MALGKIRSQSIKYWNWQSLTSVMSQMIFCVTNFLATRLRDCTLGCCDGTCRSYLKELEKGRALQVKPRQQLKTRRERVCEPRAAAASEQETQTRTKHSRVISRGIKQRQKKTWVHTTKQESVCRETTTHGCFTVTLRHWWRSNRLKHPSSTFSLSDRIKIKSDFVYMAPNHN